MKILQIAVLMLAIVVSSQALAQSCTVTLSSGTGSTIQNALNTTNPGRVICLQAGTYNVSSTIVIPSNSTLKGISGNRNTVILKGTSSLQHSLLETASGAVDITISFLTVESNGTSQSKLDAFGINVNNADYVDIENVRVMNTYRMSVAIQDSFHIFVGNSHFVQMGYAPDAQGSFWIVFSERIWISNSTIYGRNNGPGGDGGIDCYASVDISIFDNLIVNTGESSIYTTNDTPEGASCANMDVFDNTITGSNEWGIDIRGTGDFLASGNTISSSNFAAMSIWDTSNSVIQYNSMNNNNTSGAFPCQGIRLKGSNPGLVNTGNTGTSPLTCWQP